MTDIDSLIDKLREESRIWSEQVGDMPIFDQAADALSDLQKDRDRLKNLYRKTFTENVRLTEQFKHDFVGQIVAPRSGW